MTNQDNITFEMDLAYENNISEIHTYFPKSVTVKVLIENGPGGGWPVCEISGDKNVINKALSDIGFGDNEIQFMMYGE